MNDTGKIFERLIHLSRVRGLHVKFCPLKCSYARLKGDKVAIANDRSLGEMNFSLAHEIAHAYLHYDKGDILENDGSYEEQADRAAKMLIDALEAF